MQLRQNLSVLFHSLNLQIHRIFHVPFHTNLRKFMKMITKLSLSINLVGLVGEIVVNVRSAAS